MCGALPIHLLAARGGACKLSVVYLVYKTFPPVFSWYKRRFLKVRRLTHRMVYLLLRWLSPPIARRIPRSVHSSLDCPAARPTDCSSCRLSKHTFVSLVNDLPDGIPSVLPNGSLVCTPTGSLVLLLVDGLRDCLCNV